MQVEGTRWYRVKELAETFGIAPITLYRAIDAGRLRAVKFGRTVRVSEQALSEYLATGEQAAREDSAGEVA